MRRMYIYVSRWFDRRRGSALALISSGTYLAGAMWPPVFERVIAAFGWRQTMLWYAHRRDRRRSCRWRRSIFARRRKSSIPRRSDRQQRQIGTRARLAAQFRVRA